MKKMVQPMIYSNKSFMFKYILPLVLLILGVVESSSSEKCDSIRDCTGRALNFQVTSGSGAQYVDVPMRQSLTSLSSEFTVDMWLKPERQPGKREYIAGVWGPLVDKNDSWALYIDINDDIVFEINGPVNRGGEDNTIVRVPGSSYFGKWFHLAAVFDGNTQTAYLYIDDVPAGSARNDRYPASRLRKPRDSYLPMQLGSCNALLDDKANYRTLLGWMDEVRIWNYARTEDEIYCGKDISYNGDEEGLALYFRCNEMPNVYNLCDASGNGNTGRARSGARCRDGGGRQRIRTVFVNPAANINEDMKCDTTVTYNFTIQDTSRCGSSYGARILDDKVSRYTITPDRFDLLPGVINNFSVKIDRTQPGPFKSRLYVYPLNRCGVGTVININLNRKTELSMSRLSLNLGKVLADCEDVPYVDSVVTICNKTAEVTSARNLTITDIRTNLTGIIDAILPPGVTFPYTLKPGECLDITIRFTPVSNSVNHFDTLRVISDDRCYGSGIMPIYGRSQEAIGIYYPGTKKRIDTIVFKNTCIDRSSPAEQYQWEDLLDSEIEIDTIIIPEHFKSQRFRFPFNLRPATGYLPNYLQFTPKDYGDHTDSVVFVIIANGCKIRRVLYVKGKCISPEIVFETTDVDFGQVIVGQSAMRFATVRNEGAEPVTITLYMTRGDVFSATIERRTVNSGETASIPILFSPVDTLMYYDNVCYTEDICHTFGCIPVKGEGIYERFRFNPKVMKTENVLACDSRLDTMWIVNLSGKAQILDMISLNTSGKYELVDPPVLPEQIVIPPYDSVRFIFRFTPGDLTQDITEIASLHFYTMPDLDEWNAPMYGTSLLPKIFVTEETEYGTLEVNDIRKRFIKIENTSPYDLTIDSIRTTEGYYIINPAQYEGIVLKPRESRDVEIEFRPVEEKVYNGKAIVYSSSPCEVSGEGILTGKAIIMPLQIPVKAISYGFIQPCECQERAIVLLNRSLTFPMTIDSVWIDGEGLPGATPEYFSWRLAGQGNNNLPYSFDKQTSDTLYVKFCPNTPSLPQYIDHSAKIHIIAHGEGWDDTYEIYFIGKRSMMLYPTPDYVLFPPTRVDALSDPEKVDLVIPGVQYNPEQETVVIDSITFEPDERVFSYDGNIPKVISGGSQDSVMVTFRPRAVRNYRARMVMHISKPCGFKDTTVILEGNGFAPPYGISLKFMEDTLDIDTFKVINCNVLEVPVYSSREFPANVIDIHCRIGYDDTKLEFLDSDSPYLWGDTCKPFVPSLKSSVSPYGGMQFILKNLCRVDSTRPFLVARFRPKNLQRDIFKITVDSSFFDTEDVILYEIVAEHDSAYVQVLQPEISILNSIDFGRVDVLDCAQRTLQVMNTGDVPVTPDSLMNLPPDVRISGSSPPLGTYIDPGETAEITLEFCPRRKQQFDSDSLISESVAPCTLFDTTGITGEGYAPPFEFHVDLTQDVMNIDETGATIGDTINIPMLFEKDLARELNGITYWLKGLSFRVYMHYNPFALKYLRTNNGLNGNLDVDYKPGELILNYSGVDSLHARQFASNDFLVTVPDSTETMFSYDASDFDTDSILFLDLIPLGTESRMITGGKCYLTSLNFNSLKPSLAANVPNPWSYETRISFILKEDAPAVLRVYDTRGRMVKEILDGNKILPEGAYSYNITSENLVPGVYYYVLQYGAFKLDGKMILMK